MWVWPWSRYSWLLLGEDSLLELEVVAVGDGDPLAAELEIGQRAVAGDADLPGVAGQGGAVPVGVAEDECRRERRPGGRGRAREPTSPQWMKNPAPRARRRVTAAAIASTRSWVSLRMPTIDIRHLGDKRGCRDRRRRARPQQT